MKLKGVIWLRHIVDKLALKHSVETYEVEEVLSNKPRIRFVEKGERKMKIFIWLPGKPMREGICW